MNPIFERGNPEQPKGHALLYFRNSSDLEEILATYLVVLPIAVDVAKYVPPFLASQMASLAPKELSVFAFPPAPEKVESYEQLQRLADLRDDDIVAGGTVTPSDVTSLLYAVNEVVQEYSRMYTAYLEALPSLSEAPSQEATVHEVLYALMSERDRLDELTKLAGKLRFAVDGPDQELIRETENEIQVLARYLPENRLLSRLVSAVKASGASGPKLAELYLQRCYHLAQQEYESLRQVEEQIRALETSEGQE